MSGLYFEDFEVGMSWKHEIRRTVTEVDNLLLTTLTLNPQPLNLDDEFSRHTIHGKRLVNSIFTLGLMVGVSVADTTLGTTLGNLGFEEVRFPNPVFIGDTLNAETKVLAARLSKSRTDSGIVTFLHTSYNQRSELVCECRRAALMMRRTS